MKLVKVRRRPRRTGDTVARERTAAGSRVTLHDDAADIEICRTYARYTPRALCARETGGARNISEIVISLLSPITRAFAHDTWSGMGFST